MIRTFRHKGLEKFYLTGNKSGIDPQHAGKLERILDRLSAASEYRDMNYPGSALHKLSGDRDGYYSVKISGNWRVIFHLQDKDAFDVDYCDYH